MARQNKQPISGSSTFTITVGHINFEVSVGPMRTMNKFHDIGGGCPSYHVLLGRSLSGDPITSTIIRQSIYLLPVWERILERKEDKHLRQ